jgi:hypothetical protein
LVYAGPSEAGKRCVPSTLPHWPIAMYRGIPVALFVSDPRLCETFEERSDHELNWGVKKALHQVRTTPITVYVPLIMKNVAR